MGKAESIATVCVAVITLLQCERCAAVTCAKRGVSLCICDMDDGSGWINLAEISHDGTPFFTKIKGDANWEYSYNPCSVFIDNKCKDSTMVCQGGDTVCGKSTSLEWAITATAPLSGTITYGNGDDLKGVPRLAVVSFVCDESVDHDFTFTTENPDGHYQFKLVSKHVCLVPTPTVPTTTGPSSPRSNSISLGSIMDICVVCFLMMYVSGGFAYMYVRRGTRGREALPNYAFWIGFPGLVKEGVMFILGKAKGLRGSKAGYESL